MSTTLRPGKTPGNPTPWQRMLRVMLVIGTTVLTAALAPMLMVYLWTTWGKLIDTLAGGPPAETGEIIVAVASLFALTISTMKLLHYSALSLDSIAQICLCLKRIVLRLEGWFRGGHGK